MRILSRIHYSVCDLNKQIGKDRYCGFIDHGVVDRTRKKETSPQYYVKFKFSSLMHCSTLVNALVHNIIFVVYHEDGYNADGLIYTFSQSLALVNL